MTSLITTAGIVGLQRMLAKNFCLLEELRIYTNIETLQAVLEVVGAMY